MYWGLTIIQPGNSGNSLIRNDTDILIIKNTLCKNNKCGNRMKVINTRVNQGNITIHQLNGILWISNIFWNTKINIYKTIVKKYCNI